MSTLALVVILLLLLGGVGAVVKGLLWLALILMLLAVLCGVTL